MKSIFGSLNSRYQAAKESRRADELILEAVMGVDEVLPGSDEDMEETVDVDSVPDDAYKKIDAMLDKIVSDPNYDDSEAEELLDDDFGDSSDLDIDYGAIDAALDEAVSLPSWRS